MSHFDPRVERPDTEFPPLPTTVRDDEAPARRLLAHDLEHLVWDEDGEQAVPPPD
jgi:hypothetical protein